MQLEGTFGAEGMASVEIDGIIGELHVAIRDLVQGRFRANQIRWPYHLRGPARKRAIRGGVQMRPIQFDIVGLVGHIASPDTKSRTEVWCERLIAPIGRRYGERAHQRPIFEIAGAGLQEQ